jgi:hypothetical protein
MSCHRAAPRHTARNAMRKKAGTYTSPARGIARLRSFALSIAAHRTGSGTFKVTLSQ